MNNGDKKNQFQSKIIHLNELKKLEKIIKQGLVLPMKKKNT